MCGKAFLFEDNLRRTTGQMCFNLEVCASLITIETDRHTVIELSKLLSTAIFQLHLFSFQSLNGLQYPLFAVGNAGISGIAERCPDNYSL